MAIHPPTSVETLRFTDADIAQFSLASHDVNPLHTTAVYSRRTTFGQPVVFGMLGCLAAAASLPDRPGSILSGVSAIFHGPLFVDIAYQAEVQDKGLAQSRVLIRDSGRLAASIVFRFRPGEREPAPSATSCPRRTPLDRRKEDLKEGLEVAGEYAPEPTALADLIARWHLPAKGISEVQAAALLWASYVVGMEAPGERALFSRLRITFPPRTPAEGSIHYAGRVMAFDSEHGLLEIEGRLSRGGTVLAEAQLSSLVRDDPPGTDTSRLRRLLPAPAMLEGQTALVTGGSRGLGAAIVAALALQGCHVLLNYRTGQAEAEALRDSVGGDRGRITLLPGDAGDPAWCDRARSEWGHLDILILNASPPIRPLGLTADSLGRLSSFIGESLRLVAGPLAAFLGAVRDHEGLIVLISSEYARTAPPEFPHYVAAKRAAEGLALSSCAEGPGTRLLVVRPPRLITDQTNTPSGRRGAIPPENVAAALVARLQQPAIGLPAEFVEEFPADIPMGC